MVSVWGEEEEDFFFFWSVRRERSEGERPEYVREGARCSGTGFMLH